MTRLPRYDDDHGSMTLELAILAPALLLLLAALILAGRVETTSAAVEHAARVAARDASLARTPESARTTAVTSAARELAATACVSSDVAVDTSGFAAPVGTDGRIAVTLTCVIPVADLAIPGIPGTHNLTAQATSPLDRYRSR